MIGVQEMIVVCFINLSGVHTAFFLLWEGGGGGLLSLLLQWWSDLTTVKNDF